MPNPKRRFSKQRSRLKAMHKKPAIKAASNCPQCGASKLPHNICKACGYYKGRPILNINA